MSYCTDPGIGLIQFPQDYRNIGKGNCGVALDLKHFFAAYMNMANRLECVPSTGTLSLINVAALRAVDGFSAGGYEASDVCMGTLADWIALRAGGDA